MDVEKERKDHKRDFLKNKMGLPDCKIIEEMSKLGFKKISTERKGDRIMERLKFLACYSCCQRRIFAERT